MLSQLLLLLAELLLLLLGLQLLPVWLLVLLLAGTDAGVAATGGGQDSRLGDELTFTSQASFLRFCHLDLPPTYASSTLESARWLGA
jgi:hypothetical protein